MTFSKKNNHIMVTHISMLQTQISLSEEKVIFINYVFQQHALNTLIYIYKSLSDRMTK